MRFSEFYSGVAQTEEEVSQPPSPANNTATVPAMAGTAAAVSWLGIVIALILLRVLYEVAE